MTTEFQRPNIFAMTGYTPGEQPADPATIKLNTNENPYPPSPQVFDALRQFDAAHLRRYPNPTASDFRLAAAKLHGVAPEQIIATRGGDELLRLILTTFVDPGDSVAVAEPSYSLYPVLTAIQGGQLFDLGLTSDWRLAPDYVDRANKALCKVAFIVNPHAPSGALMDEASLRTIAEAFNGLILIDEAYVDFVSNAGHDLTQFAVKADNVVLLRTLSKGYGLAGLRFGYGIGHARLIEPMLTKTRDSYNLDAISQSLALAAIRDQRYIEKTRRQVIEARLELQVALGALGFEVAPSHANFVLATVPRSGPSALSIYHALKSRKILVRYFDQDRLRDKLRITVGTPEEQHHLIKELREILQRD